MGGGPNGYTRKTKMTERLLHFFEHITISYKRNTGNALLSRGGTPTADRLDPYCRQVLFGL